MAISITIDNDQSTLAVDPLLADETPDVQTTATTDDGNEIDVTLTAAVGGTLGGFAAAFNTFLNSLPLTDAQKVYARDNDGASSASDFVKVTVTAAEEISNLFFSDPAGQALDGDEVVGLLTLDGDQIYLWTDGNFGSTEDYCVATTSNIAGAGEIVAAFYLNEDTTDHLSAQVQMVTFEPLSHPDGGDPDDGVNFTSLLNVGASGSVSFSFDELESGNFLWVAIGSSSSGLLVTGQDLNVNDTAGTKLGNLVNGGSDPCDTINTSQGGINATIGVNSQHFVGGPKVGGQLTDGPVAVMTFVTGFEPLDGVAQATGIDVEQIDYSNYINSSSCSIFISQTTGGSNTAMKISLWEAGGGGVDQAPGDLVAEEGYSGTNSYIGDQGTDSHLTDDTAVDVASVTIGAFTWLYTEANIATTGVTKNGITVKIIDNAIIVTGPMSAGSLIEFTALDDAGSSVDGTFNRVTVQGLAGTGAFDIGRVDLSEVTAAVQALGDQLIVEDDGPTIGPINEGLVEFAADATGSVTHSLNGVVDTDDATTPYTLVDFTAQQTINGVVLEGVLENSATQVTYYQDTNGDTVFGNAGDTAYYRLTLDQTGAGAYTFAVLQPPPPAFLEFDFTDLPSGQNLFGIIAADKTDLDGRALLVISANADVANPGNGQMTNISGTVNTSKGGGPVTIGDSNQMYDPGEGAIFCYLDNPDNDAVAGVTGGLTQKTADDADTIGFAGTFEINHASVDVVQVQGNGLATMNIKPYDVTIANVDSDAEARAFAEDPLATGSQVGVEGVVVKLGNTVLASATDLDHDGVAEVVVASGTIGIQFLETSVGSGIYYAQVSGITAGCSIEFLTDGDHDATWIENVAGKYDIGGFNMLQGLDTPDQFFEFTALVTDGDGDSALACWEVGIDGTGAYDDNAVAGIQKDTASDCVLDAASSLVQESSLLTSTIFRFENSHHDFMMI